ncbi:MAG TPA: TonB-dependent receptor [Verrucomicrobiae bacterium]|jgi:outer membrane receptor protein involved in Fe transport
MKQLGKTRLYWSVISLAALSCGGVALAQTNAVMGSVEGTNSVAETATNVANLGNMTIVGQLNQARSQIVPDLGATVYTVSQAQIASLPQGANTPFNQVLLQTPGMAQDSLGQVHLRGEHANLQYRIDDVILPEGVTGFGQELDPRFVDSMQLITGSLPAEYGYRTAGIVDIQTRSGAFENGGSGEVYGGTYDTIEPSFEYAGSQGKWNYFMDGSYNHNSLGIENPMPSHYADHDDTGQYRTFLYGSRILSDTSRITVMGSLDYANFQIPINPAQAQTPQPAAASWSADPNAQSPNDLNDNQNEQNYYSVVAYQKSAGNLDFQVSAFGRESGAHYVPDNVDATVNYNNGVATDEHRLLNSGGAQADASYELGDKHTIRGGFMLNDEIVAADATTWVFPVDGAGNETVPGEAPENIVQDETTHALFYGVYLQDEWKIVPKLTLNYGARFDVFSSTTDHQNQPSPRANLIYQPTDSTTFHAGYARYFTPPPQETVPAGNLAAFNNTSGAQGYTQDSPVKAERANYFDAGVSQKILPGLTAGVDGYYKKASNQLDDGFFGQSLILSSFNYSEGRIYGVEFTTSYEHGGFSSYANVAWGQAEGKGASTAQFLWGDAATVAYVNSHYIFLDHDQRVTGSFGAAYTWKESERYSTRLDTDALYGSGLREDSTDGSGNTIPNGASVPSYFSVNVGAEQAVKLNHGMVLKARFDLVNLTDNIYQLRSGSGVGVNAAQYGERLGFFGSLALTF